VPTAKRFTLTGGKAILVLAAIAAFTLFRLSERSRTLDPEAKNVLKSWLVAEYARPVLAAIKASRIDEEKARKLMDSSKVELTSISARGCGRDSEVRVEVMVAGRTPPDGRSVRYFRMRYSLVGWSLEAESNALFYHLTLCGG
jgi:hypothetical protein